MNESLEQKLLRKKEKQDEARKQSELKRDIEKAIFRARKLDAEMHREIRENTKEVY